jgi:hypothetical protein
LFVGKREGRRSRFIALTADLSALICINLRRWKQNHWWRDTTFGGGLRRGGCGGCGGRGRLVLCVAIVLFRRRIVPPTMGDHKGQPIGIKLRTSSSPSVGARVVGSGWEGLDGRPRPVPLPPLLQGHDPLPTPGDHQGPPTPTSTALAPPARSASCPASWLSLMDIGRPQGSTPLQFICYFLAPPAHFRLG